jgi:hypothetical protein
MTALGNYLPQWELEGKYLSGVHDPLQYWSSSVRTDGQLTTVFSRVWSVTEVTFISLSIYISVFLIFN